MKLRRPAYVLGSLVNSFNDVTLYLTVFDRLSLSSQVKLQATVGYILF